MTSSTPFDSPRADAGFWRRRLSPRAWGGLLLAGITVYLILPPSEGCACGTPRGYRALLKSELGLVIIAQESFFADSLRYGRDPVELGFERAARIHVTVDTATRLGYRARAAFAITAPPVLRRAGTCVVWVGDSALALPTVPEAEPRCWVPRRPLWRYGRYRSPGPELQ
jgi:hypothetical protein